MIRFSEVLARSKRPTDNDYRLFPVLTRISKPTTWVLLNLGVSANQTTFLFFLAAVASAGFFALGTTTATVVGAALYWLHLILDMSDGDIARYHQRFALNGQYWDHVVHLFTVPLMLSGVALGELRHGASDGIVAAALLLTIAGTFNYGLNDVARLATAASGSEDEPHRTGSWIPKQGRWVLQVARRLVGVSQFVFFYTLAVVFFEDPLWRELVIVGSAFAMLLAAALKALMAHRHGSLPRRHDLLT